MTEKTNLGAMKEANLTFSMPCFIGAWTRALITRGLGGDTIHAYCVFRARVTGPIMSQNAHSRFGKLYEVVAARDV